MILSALLTSVGINLGLCLLFFTLYSVLRRQPINERLYAPRLVADRKLKQRSGFNFERLLPSVGWVKRAWDLSEEDLLENSGLDGVVFMRIFTFSLKIFSIASVIGIAVLLPVNFMGNQLEIDFSDLPNKSLDSFSISNVNNGSNRLWIHFCASYLFTVAVCYLLYYEYKYLSLKRVDCFYASQPQPHQFTILVRGIPVIAGQSLDDSVDHFFREFHPSTYISHTIVRRTSRLQQLTDAEKLYRTVAQLKSQEHTSQGSRYCGCLGLFRNKEQQLSKLEKRLEVVEDNMRIEQSSSVGKEVPAAFVYFKSRYGAAIALHIQQGINPTQWVTEQAPEPDDVFWPFFSSSYIKRWICKLWVFCASALLTVLFFLPVLVVQSLTHLEQLETYFPFLKSILALTFVSQVITGYLPSLILQLFLYFIPPIMKMLSSIQGYISMSEILKSACSKMLWFTIWNVFFANVLSGSALYGFDLFLEPKRIPMLLAQGVPAQATFFISYVVTSGWTNLSSELVQLFALVCSFLKRIFSGEESDDLVVPSIPYEKEIPRILSFGLLGVTYFLLAPLILPFILVYFCMGYLIFRNQLLTVYAPKHGSGGKYWTIVHNSTIFSLVLMQIIAIGIFGLKDLPLASSLTIPLPVLTLLFNEYCRQRFLPIFTAYPTECLVTKDRKEQGNPRMAEFLDKLVDAYQDPAIRPKYNDRDDDTHTSPLLRSSEIGI
ncbi:CSC1-like protein HYP1 isoform X2 [Silene latifolia]|uniref:CSC1-like protein HYP1 isoform X2 n=1 Tax=Silene latifolia TaxID=37657 RepID=UPI003D76DF83